MRIHHLVTLLTAVAAAACREGTGARPVLGISRPDALAARLELAPGADEGRWTLRGVVDAGAKAGRIAGFRVRVALPLDVAVLGEARTTDEVARTVNVGEREIVAAGVLAEGATSLVLFAVDLRTTNAAVLSTLRLEILELIDERGADRLERTVVVEQPVRVR